MFENADNLTFGFDLQLFAEGEIQGEPVATTTEAIPAVETADNADPRATMSLTDYFSRGQASEDDVTPSTTEPAPETESGGPPDAEPEVTTEPQPPVMDVPDKFKNPDGSVNIDALAKAYINMEQMYPRIKQDPQAVDNMLETNKQLQAQNQELNQKFLTLIETMQAQTAQKEPELSPEEKKAREEAEMEAFWEKYNQNPKQAIMEMVNQAVKPMVEPLHQEMQYRQEVEHWNNQIQAFSQSHADFDEMLPAIREVVAEYGDMLKGRPDAIEIAYNFAKAKQVTSAPEPEPAQPPTVEEMLNDQNVLAQIVQNPAIKKLILEQHVQEIKNNPAPPVIGSQPGGLAPSTEPKDLTNIKTAKEALRAKYAGFRLT